MPLRKLNKHLMKLPRNLKNDQVSEVNRRLKALGTMNLPIPKGPMPKNIHARRPARAQRSAACSADPDEQRRRRPGRAGRGPSRSQIRRRDQQAAAAPFARRAQQAGRSRRRGAPPAGRAAHWPADAPRNVVSTRTSRRRPASYHMVSRQKPQEISAHIDRVDEERRTRAPSRASEPRPASGRPEALTSELTATAASYADPGPRASHRRCACPPRRESLTTRTVPARGRRARARPPGRRNTTETHGSPTGNRIP